MTEEKAKWGVDGAMEAGIYRAFEQISDEIFAGKYTKAEAEQRLFFWDMADYFRDWWAEGDD